MSRFSFLLLILISASSGLKGANADDPYDRLRDRLDRTEQALEESERKARRAEAQAERLRSMLVDQTLEVKAEVKERERQEALARLQEVEQLEKRHKQEQNLRNWAVANFDDTRHGRLPEMNVGRRLKRLQKAKLLATRALLEFPDLSRLAIINGRALNTFLDLCGKAALNHQQYKNEFARLQGLGHRVGGNCLLRREDLEKLRFTKGPRKNAMVFDATRGALTLDWPPILHSDGKYSVHFRALEKAKEKALEDLRNGKRVNALTKYEMFEAADKIRELFAKEYEFFCGDWKRGKYDANYVSEYLAAERFVFGLRSDIAQFVQALTIDDVTSDELFDPQDGLLAGQQNNAIAVEDLMAFMVKRGYRFGEATQRGEHVYKAIYDQMVDYYMDLHAIQVAMEKKESEFAEMERDAEELLRSSRWDPTQDLVAALTAKPPENFLDYAMLLAQSVSKCGVSLQRQTARPVEPKPKWTEFEVGDRVSNKGYKIWWRGHVVELVGHQYRVEMFFVGPQFQRKWQTGAVYEFSEGQIKRL